MKTTRTTPTAGEAKRALHTLVTGETTSPRAVVDEAEPTLTSIEAALRFLAGDGDDRLAEAVVQAVREEDAETARRGRRVLAALQALEAALEGVDTDSDSRADGRTLSRFTSTPLAERF